MRNLFVFVEGKEDLLFVKKVLHNLFIKHSINIIQYLIKKQEIMKSKSSLKLLRLIRTMFY